ncbi:MAG: type II secretion system protein [Candidatus Pacebacteria bacterium]|nr:type II secretion system protein [Candidatus Paceibacterota bacterium]
MNIFKTKNNSKQKGFLLIGVMIFAAISILTITAVISWAAASGRLSRKIQSREVSLQIAEAGIEYARWYLAHYQTGYTLGNVGAGPYVYPFNDKDGNQIGSYTLTVTPPLSGSTLVKIKSKGATLIDPTATRSINVHLAIPSLAKYSVLANSDMRFGEGTVVYGPIHSNGGIRFDGVIWNKITSSKTSYSDPDHTGSNEFGVHTHVNSGSTTVNDSYRPGEAPPSSVPNRSDVFKAGREFPVPAADFTGITNDLATIKAQAIASGRYFASSGYQGYQIILKTNDTFDLYRVTSLAAAPSGCSNVGTDTNWGTWSIGNKTFIANYAIPANGLIFAEDHIWVEGTINTARVTIAAARFPDNSSLRKSITINNALRYTNYNGSDVIALIAQDDINIGLFSADTFQIDAALIAQNGRVGRHYYLPPTNGAGTNKCGSTVYRNSVTLFGMIATNLRYGFAYTDDTGYENRIINYDTNLLYAPPPNFPLASDKYQIILWEELEN